MLLGQFSGLGYLRGAVSSRVLPDFDPDLLDTPITPCTGYAHPLEHYLRALSAGHADPRLPLQAALLLLRVACRLLHVLLRELLSFDRVDNEGVVYFHPVALMGAIEDVHHVSLEFLVLVDCQIRR